MSALSETTPSAEVLTSPSAVALWLRFQCNPAATLHDSYRELLVSDMKTHRTHSSDTTALAQKTIKREEPQEDGDEPNEPTWLRNLWGTPQLSRLVCERFALRCDNWPHPHPPSSARAASPLPFFLRLVMLEKDVLLRLLKAVGLVLSSREIVGVIEKEEVVRLKRGLSEEDYAFALAAGAALRPSKQRVRLRFAARQRASLGDLAFHTVVGLRLLLLCGEGSLTDQHWRRLALKCPRGIVDVLRASKRREIGKNLTEGLDEGTAAGLLLPLAVFEDEATGVAASQNSAVLEKFWSQVAKEVIESWHDWLVFSKVA